MNSLVTQAESLLRIYFIRHGDTEWSVSGRHTGTSDIPLTCEGKDQARALRPFLQKLRFQKVLTSPARRARLTCELAGLGGQSQVEPNLAEWHYGDYEGLLTSQIDKVRPDWNVYTDGCPSGEMPCHVAGRADELIGSLSTTAGNVALFSHGQFGSVLAARWIGLPPAEGRHFHLGTASVSILGFEAAHPNIPVFELWNWET